MAASNYDLCFTHDAEFSRRVRLAKSAARLKLVHVLIPQTRQDEFVLQFNQSPLFQTSVRILKKL